jgi:16S rRNA (cytosine967-C5)-methyltransferase
LKNARSIAVKVIADIERNKSYSNITADIKIKEAELDTKDSAFATLLIYGCLQRKITLDYVIETYSKSGKSKLHPFVSALLKTGIYQILYMDKVPSSAAVNESVNIVKNSKQRFAAGFVNAVLRNVSNNKELILKNIDNADESIKYSCPKEIIKSLKTDYSETEAIKFLEESLNSPVTYARVNNIKTDTEVLLSSLKSQGVICEAIELKGAFWVENVGLALKSKEFKDGLFFIQDKASQIAVNSLYIGMNMSVLDVCSAPGGKSFTAACLLNGTGSVTSCDIYEKRVGLVHNGAKRLGFFNIKSIVNDASVYNPNLGLFDRIICDVPCSGLGVIRRKPEIKYKIINDYDSLPELQLKILETSVKYLKPNGKIMYSTCTLRNAENSDVVAKFLSSHSEFKLEEERTLMPQNDNTDGFYFSIMERTTCE